MVVKMKKYLGLMIGGFIFVMLIACVVTGTSLYFGIYNKIISTNQNVSRSIGDLNTEYQRRYALIDNLVAITKETKSFEKYLVEIEKEIYVKTAEAKASASKMDISLPESVKKRIASENQLGSILTNAMDKLMVMAQKYPTITDPTMKDRNKTFESLSTLRKELKDIEENIIFARKSVNEYVRVYNSSILMFPGNIIAGTMGKTEIKFFDTIDEGVKKDVKISF